MSHPLELDLGLKYTLHFRLFGKFVIDFLLMILNVFAGSYDRGTTSENLLNSVISERRGSL